MLLGFTLLCGSEHSQAPSQISIEIAGMFVTTGQSVDPGPDAHNLFLKAAHLIYTAGFLAVLPGLRKTPQTRRSTVPS